MPDAFEHVKSSVGQIGLRVTRRDAEFGLIEEMVRRRC